MGGTSQGAIPAAADGGALAEVVELLKSTAYAVHVLDADRRVVYQSPQAAELLGAPVGEAIGQCCPDLIGGCDRDGHPVCKADCAIFERLRQREPVESYDLLARRGDGGWTAINITMATLSFEGAEPLAVQLFQPAEPAVPSSAKSGPRGPDMLTSREVQVLQLVAAGNGVPEIAGRLVLSGATVRNHIRNLMAKLDAHTRLQAVLAAAQAGIL